VDGKFGLWLFDGTVSRQLFGRFAAGNLHNGLNGLFGLVSAAP
jgi:hypothetical protein